MTYVFRVEIQTGESTRWEWLLSEVEDELHESVKRIALLATVGAVPQVRVVREEVPECEEVAQ